MSKKPLALLALSGAVVCGVLAWVVSGSGARRSAPVARVDAPVAAAPAPRSAPELAAARPSAESAPGPAPEGRSLAGKAPEAEPFDPARQESFDLAGARWIEVEVTLPESLKPDDAPALVAIAQSTTEDFAESSELVQHVGLGTEFARERHSSRSGFLFSGGSADGVAPEPEAGWSRRPLARAGRTRLPLPADARGCVLVLQSRYLYAAPRGFALAADGRDTMVTLEAEPGAFVFGRCVLPDGLVERGLDPAAVAESIELEITVTASDAGLVGLFERADRRALVLDDELAFAGRAVPLRARLGIAAQVDGIENWVDIKHEVGEARRDEIVIPFRLGAIVEGRVTGDEGTPLEGARVSCESKGLRMFYANDGVESDAEGRYRLKGVPAGRVTVNARLHGWRDAEGQPLELHDGAVVRDVDLVLPAGASIGGRTTFADGTPARATVRASSAQDRWSTTTVETEADEDGRFELQGLGEEPVFVRASVSVELPPAEEDPERALWRLESRAAWALSVAPGTDDLRLVLEDPVSFRARVVDDTGAPVTHFAVTAQPELGGLEDIGELGVVAALTSESGRFAMEVPRPGTWSVVVRTDGYAPSAATPIEVPSTEEIELVLARASALTGTVLDPAGLPVAGADVRAGRSAGSPMEGGGSESAESDAEGRFSIEIEQHGALEVLASHEDWADSEARIVSVEPGRPSEELVLHLRVGARITGEVFDEHGERAGGRDVTAGSGRDAFGGGGKRDVSDADGRFVLEHVTPGKVTVSAMPSQQELLDTMAEAEDETAMIGLFGKIVTTTIEVQDGEEVHVVLGARPKAPVRVHGTVTDARRGLGDAMVLVIAEGGAMMQGMKVAQTDENGRYEVVVDRPGDYAFGIGRQGDEPQASFPVTVPEGEEFELDLALPGGRIAGRVVGPEGAAAALVQVRLQREGGALGLEALVGDGKATDAEGRFSFDHVFPGTYLVRAGASAPPARYAAGVVDGIEVRGDRGVEDLVIRLDAPGKLAGLVRDGRGAPVSGASIFVRDGAGRVLTNVSTTRSDGAGRFGLDGVPPGPVTVFARGDSVATARDVGARVASGETTEVTLVVEPGSFLVVSLLDEGEPVRARLRVEDEDGRVVSGLYAASAIEALVSEGFSSKEQRIGPLAPGTYRLVAVAPDGKDAKKTVEIKPGQEERPVKLRLR